MQVGSTWREHRAVQVIQRKSAREAMSERSRGDASDIDGQNREVEWSFWEKRHRRQSREGSGEEAGMRPSFKWAGAHESARAANEFQIVEDNQPSGNSCLFAPAESYL